MCKAIVDCGNGSPRISLMSRMTMTSVHPVRKLPLLNLFNSHALVALKILARQLGMEEAGPKRLRRAQAAESS